MDWNAILARANCPDSPGRALAVQEAKALAKAKAEARHRPKASKSSRRGRFPGLKHSAQ